MEQRAVVVEWQTRYLEGVVGIARVGSSPTDRISEKARGFRAFFIFTAKTKKPWYF